MDDGPDLEPEKMWGAMGAAGRMELGFSVVFCLIPKRL
jgi:hypothetical protein